MKLNDDYRFEWLLGEITKYWNEENNDNTLNKSCLKLTPYDVERFLVVAPVTWFCTVAIYALLLVPLYGGVSRLTFGSLMLGLLAISICSIIVGVVACYREALVTILRRSLFFREKTQELEAKKERFLVSPQFRIEETLRFLTKYKIPALRESLEKTKADISSKMHNRRSELEVDYAAIKELIIQDCFVSEVQKGKVKDVQLLIETELKSMAEPHELVEVLNKTTLEMETANSIAQELERILIRLHASDKVGPILQKYKVRGYDSANINADRLFAEQIQKLEDINHEVGYINSAGIEVINEVKQLHSAASPIEKLIESNSIN